MKTIPQLAEHFVDDGLVSVRSKMPDHFVFCVAVPLGKIQLCRIVEQIFLFSAGLDQWLSFS